MSFRLVASDLDGTLLRSDGTLSARTIAAIHRAVDGGAEFVYATGRPPRWVRPVADDLGLHGYAICANGAVTIHLGDDEVIGERLIAPDDAAKLVAAILSVAPTATFAVERPGDGYARDPAYRMDWEPPPDMIVAPIEDLVLMPLVKLLVRDPAHHAEALEALMIPVVGGLAEPTRSSVDLVELMVPGTTKALALATVAARLGLGPADVVAFGDMPNDVAMLTWAGLGVAMANAHPLAVGAADEVTSGNDHDGVAAVLERLFS